MQRAVQREEKPKKEEEEEVKLDANFGFSSTTVKKRWYGLVFLCLLYETYYVKGYVEKK